MNDDVKTLGVGDDILVSGGDLRIMDFEGGVGNAGVEEPEGFVSRTGQSKAVRFSDDGLSKELSLAGRWGDSQTVNRAPNATGADGRVVVGVFVVNEHVGRG